MALKIKGMTNELFVLWRFSLPAFLSSTIVSPVIWVANLILANQKEGFAQLALVNASNQVRMVLLVLPTLICTAALPVISSEHTQANGSGGSKEAIDIAQKYSSIIVLPLFSCLVFFAGPIMMLYGPEFLPGSSVFIGIMFATGISAVGSIIGISMASMDRMWAGLGLNVIWAAIFLIVLSQLASKWGANAYAFSFSAAYIVLFSLTNWYQKERMLRITFVRIFISGAYLLGITILCLFTPAEWRLIMLLPVCMATIIFSLWIFNINWNGKRQYGPRKEEGCQ